MKFTIVLLCTLSVMLTTGVNSLAQNKLLMTVKNEISVTEVQIVSIDDTSPIFANINYEPKATFYNSGTTMQNFDTTMKISGIYHCTRNISLPAKAAITVIFDSTILNRGEYDFCVEITGTKNGVEFQKSLSDKISISN